MTRERHPAPTHVIRRFDDRLTTLSGRLAARPPRPPGRRRPAAPRPPAKGHDRGDSRRSPRSKRERRSAACVAGLIGISGKPGSGGRSRAIPTESRGCEPIPPRVPQDVTYAESQVKAGSVRTGRRRPGPRVWPGCDGERGRSRSSVVRIALSAPSAARLKSRVASPRRPSRMRLRPWRAMRRAVHARAGGVEDRAGSGEAAWRRRRLRSS
jgi:hypothetical protein